MAEQLLLGAHTSTAGGVQNALLEGQEIGATTIQLFTSNQKQWKGRHLLQEQIEVWNQVRQETGLTHLMSHDSYLINLGSPKEDILEKSRIAFREEIERSLLLGLTFVNFHPGAALTDSREACLERIVASLLGLGTLLEKAHKHDLTLLLETTAGQGSVIGCSFEEIAWILDHVKDKVPIGVCIDTCHIFVAGYDIRSPEGWETVLSQFEQTIGLKYLRALHLNDSQKGLGSRVDRHAPLGEGEIGWDCFKFLMQDSRMRPIPKYLETPGGPAKWKKEIEALKGEWSAH